MFGSDGSPIVQYVVIFAVIFTALAAIVFLVRRLTGRGLALAGRAGGRGRQPRLGIVDVYELDRARQLILLRRDNVEHLLLVGGPNDVVVERNIQRGQRPLPEVALRPEAASGALSEPLPDPLAGAGRLPEPPRALPEIAGRRPFEPGFEMPVVVPSPVPGSGAAPPVTLPLDAALLAGDEPGQEVGARDHGPRDIAVPARPGPSAAPSTPPSGSEAPARQPFSARRLLRRTLPPALDPRPEPASERRSGEAPAGAAPTPPEDAPAELPQAITLPPPVVPADRRAVDPGILSDMARQLQAALARPASAVTPAPAPPLAPSPAPESSDPAPAVDPVAAAMAAAPAMPEPTPPPAAAAPAPAAAPPQRPVPPPRPEPAAAPLAPPQAAAAPERAAAAQPQAPAAPVQAPPAPTSPGNPFSVEEIEAEFARLLGRPLDRRE